MEASFLDHGSRKCILLIPFQQLNLSGLNKQSCFYYF